MLGEPINHCYEEGDDYVLFLFEDRPDDSEIAQRWKETFGGKSV